MTQYPYAPRHGSATKRWQREECVNLARTQRPFTLEGVTSDRMALSSSSGFRDDVIHVPECTDRCAKQCLRALCSNSAQGRNLCYNKAVYSGETSEEAVARRGGVHHNGKESCILTFPWL